MSQLVGRPAWQIVPLLDPDECPSVAPWRVCFTTPMQKQVASSSQIWTQNTLAFGANWQLHFMPQIGSLVLWKPGHVPVVTHELAAVSCYQ